MHDVKKIFEELYKDINGIAISNKAKSKLSSWYMGNIYGEITYSGFLKMLALAGIKKGETFYDLGSGTGKCVLLAALATECSRSVGIEILDELHMTACHVLSTYRKQFLQENENKKAINFIQGDFKYLDISDADVIFMNATCMQYEIDLPFTRKIERLKKGTRILTNTLYLLSEEYQVQPLGPIAFSWGDEQVFLHTKK